MVLCKEVCLLKPFTPISGGKENIWGLEKTVELSLHIIKDHLFALLFWLQKSLVNWIQL